MKPKIALISAKHTCDYIKETIAFYDIRFEDELKLDYFSYDHISELLPLYQKIYPRYDAFCLTGISGRILINSASQDKDKPVLSISVTASDYYKEFFYLLRENRKLDLKKIAIDSSLWINESIPGTVEEFIAANKRFSSERNSLFNKIEKERILNAEKAILEKASSLMESGKAELILCRFDTAYPILKSAGIKCAFVYPAGDAIADTINLLAEKARLARAQRELPAVIYVSYPKLAQKALTGSDEELLDLQRCILDFDKEHTAGFVLKSAPSGCEIYTTRAVAERLTDGFKSCLLSAFILGKTGKPAGVGYGIGNNVMQARYNAFKAYEPFAKEAGSRIIFEDGSIKDSLDKNEAVTLPAKVSGTILNAAESSKLSIATVQRIAAVAELLGKDELTTNELADAMHVTAANANRFLNALLSAGFAEIAAERRAYSKGRPSRIYKLLFTN